MLKNTCYLCLSVNKRTTNIYKTHLRHAYESLAHYKICNNDCWMCYICYTRLQQCHRLQQLAVQTRGIIDGIGQSKKKIAFGVYEPLLELSIYKMENITVKYPNACNIKQEVDVKTETSNEDVTQEEESVEEDEQFSIKLEENELLSDVGCEQNISIVDSCRSRVRSAKNMTITHPTVCSIKQELDVKTETSNEDVAEEDESVETSNDYEENEESSIKLEENELLVNYGDWEQGVSSADSCRRSRMPELISVRLSQSVIDKYARQSPPTHTATDKYLEDKGKCTDEPSVESEDMKHEIKEEVVDTGIEQDIEQETAIVSEGRDHASEAQSGGQKTPHICEICSKSFGTKHHLLKHIRTHTKEKIFSCDICKKNFTQKKNLKQHIRVHTGEKPFSCDVCKQNFTQSGNLKRHLRVHTGEKPYSCDICKKNFTQKESLNLHIRVHTGEKPFKCHLCQKSFAEKNRLKKHIRVHTGENAFNCHFCEKSFAEKNCLKKHISVHTRDKPFSCNICLKTFTRNDSLKVHVQIHNRQN